jgi:carbon storage regulator CsrA
MLVLTRKSQERIFIGDNIQVTILRVKGNAVRLGIDAPASVRVVRGELIAKPAAAASPLGVSSAGRALETMANSSDAATTDEASEDAPESAVLRSRAPLADYLLAAAHAV